MKIVTTTNIIFERKMYPEGTPMDLSEAQATSLMDQGLAKRPTRTVVVEDDAVATPEPKASASASTTAQATEPEVESAPSKALGKMNREELEAVAEEAGLDNLEQYDTKAALMDAIKGAQG